MKRVVDKYGMEDLAEGGREATYYKASILDMHGSPVATTFAVTADQAIRELERMRPERPVILVQIEVLTLKNIPKKDLLCEGCLQYNGLQQLIIANGELGRSVILDGTEAMLDEAAKNWWKAEDIYISEEPGLYLWKGRIRVDQYLEPYAETESCKRIKEVVKFPITPHTCGESNEPIRNSD